MAKNFFTPAQESAIIQAIKQAEKSTSGEIRVHLEEKLHNKDTFNRALELFGDLQMHQTRERNGVLFYVAIAPRKFAIVGDEGIHRVVSDSFWDNIKELMLMRFKKGQFAEGLCEGILAAGEQLKHYFPYTNNDENELSNDISFGA